MLLQLSGVTDLEGRSYIGISLEGGDFHPFVCTADDPEFQALRKAQLDTSSVKVAGDRLFAALRAHPEVSEYLQTALQTDAGNRYPVLVQFSKRVGLEALPWEVLCSPDGEFFGLDERFSLARTVISTAPATPEYQLAPPLRIAAVLSCLDISASGELDALRAAIRAGNTEHVKLLVVASEEQLIRDLQAEMEAGDASEVAQVEVIPPDVSALQRLISGFRPHVLHFFCHGSRKGPHLAMALKSDWETAPPRISSLGVEAADFKNFKRDTDNTPWLLVLNCCEGAAVDPEADAHSLAFRVASSGFAPAVVGMREPVISDTANLLTKALYTKLLTDLGDRFNAAASTHKPLDWPSLVVAARDKLARARPGVVLSEAAASTKEWTLPVVYVRPQEFSLKVLPRRLVDEEAARAARLEIQALQELLVKMSPDQAAALRAEAEARIKKLGDELGIDVAIPAGGR